MNPQELKNTMNLKYAEYFQKLYEGVLPKDIIETFKKAIFHLAPSVHKLHKGTLRDIFSKEPNKLTVREVGIITDVILNCPQYLIYDDLNLAMHKTGQIQDVGAEWEVKLRKKEQEFNDEMKTPQILNQNGAKIHKM